MVEDELTIIAMPDLAKHLEKRVNKLDLNQDQVNF